ncbi:MAG: helix-turn-helix transcriptional regulator [Adlercreutzia equolifaciens]
MTQEFVAHELGVSRQAVSKWEKGTSDPSTHNLIALAELYRRRRGHPHQVGRARRQPSGRRFLGELGTAG